jgi:hypothetical protein
LRLLLVGRWAEGLDPLRQHYRVGDLPFVLEEAEIKIRAHVASLYSA